MKLMKFLHCPYHQARTRLAALIPFFHVTTRWLQRVLKGDFVALTPRLKFVTKITSYIYLPRTNIYHGIIDFVKIMAGFHLKNSKNLLQTVTYT